jgi:hypothetical protein
MLEINHIETHKICVVFSEHRTHRFEAKLQIYVLLFFGYLNYVLYVFLLLVASRY